MYNNGMNNTITSSTGKTFTLKKGINDQEIDQLIQYAQSDETVRQFTSDASRFASRISFDEWRKEGTVFYTLNDAEGNLAGIIWFEPLPIPEFNLQENAPIINSNEYQITFAIRTYGSARGKGLSSPFTQKALEDFERKGVWLATSADNYPAINSYKKSGFVELGMRKDGQKLIMVLQ